LILLVLFSALPGCSSDDDDDDDDDDGNDVDVTPPAITASVEPAANAAGWHNTDVTVTFDCSDADSGIATCPDDVIVDTEGEAQSVTGTATDIAGNSATATVTINLDNTAPVLADFMPAGGATVPLPGVNLTGSVDDTLSGLVGVTCADDAVSNDAALNDAETGGYVFGCSVPLEQGTQEIVVEATDVADNVNSSPLTLTHIPLPTITIDSPPDRSLVEDSPLTVTGTIDDPGATVVVGGVAATVANDRFEAAVPIASGVQVLNAVATNAAGSTTTSLQLLAVIDPPELPTVQVVTPNEAVVLGGQVGEVDHVNVQGWVRDNRETPTPDAPIVAVTIEERTPDGNLIGTSALPTTVSQGTRGLCSWADRCWRFDGQVPITSTEGFLLNVEVEAQTGSFTGSHVEEGVVDLCYPNNGENNASGACDAAVTQRNGCTQSRRCIENSNGCPTEFGATRNDPVDGEFGRASTTFGRDEAAGTADGAFTVFGQARPVQLPCNRHDECYHQWCPTEGADYAGIVAEKQACNLRFASDMEAVCEAAYPEFDCPEGRIGAANCDAWSEEKNECFAWARTYFEFVSADADRYLVAGSHYDEWPYGGFLTPNEGCPAIQ
jgi:hypothetical protein